MENRIKISGDRERIFLLFLIYSALLDDIMRKLSSVRDFLKSNDLGLDLTGLNVGLPTSL